VPRRDVAAWLRAGAVGFVVLALAASAVEVGREGSEGTGSSQSAPSRDPLAIELERCNAITPASGRDGSCERAWAENRRRFLGARPAVPAESDAAALPSPPAGVHP